MKFIKSKKGIALLAISVVAAVAAVGAYSYFTTSGSGTGSAAVGSATVLANEISQTNTITGLVPGGPAKAVEYSIVNAAGNGDQNLGKVTISGISVSDAPGTCTADDFKAVDPGAAVGTVADDATYDSTLHPDVEPSIEMVDTGANQDGCQGATLSLTLSAAAGS